MMRKKYSNLKPHKMGGFTILEAMIGALVIAFGFLNYAYIAHKSVKSAHDNALRSRAILLTSDILEKMRANYAVAAKSAQGYTAEHQKGTRLQATSDCDQRPCSEDELRDWDLYRWHSALDAELLDAKSRISFKNLPDGSREYTITLDYSPRSPFTATADPHQGKFVMTTVL